MNSSIWNLPQQPVLLGILGFMLTMPALAFAQDDKEDRGMAIEELDPLEQHNLIDLPQYRGRIDSRKLRR